MSGVKEAMMPSTVDEAPSDFAKTMIGAPIMICTAMALKTWNQWALKEPGG